MTYDWKCGILTRPWTVNSERKIYDLNLSFCLKTTIYRHLRVLVFKLPLSLIAFVMDASLFFRNIRLNNVKDKNTKSSLSPLKYLTAALACLSNSLSLKIKMTACDWLNFDKQNHVTRTSGSVWSVYNILNNAFMRFLDILMYNMRFYGQCRIFWI
jgi:hypothetical protein